MSYIGTAPDQPLSVSFSFGWADLHGGGAPVGRRVSHVGHPVLAKAEFEPRAKAVLRVDFVFASSVGINGIRQGPLE